jgi:hypothetical protein
MFSRRCNTSSWATIGFAVASTARDLILRRTLDRVAAEVLVVASVTAVVSLEWSCQEAATPG